uniref:Uncharacterized protein n=1 Tax=Octopus bimaculoides TaxID=37653 RepID=A0A0L8GTQ7_OCTBM
MILFRYETFLSGFLVFFFSLNKKSALKYMKDDVGEDESSWTEVLVLIDVAQSGDKKIQYTNGSPSPINVVYSSC